MTLYNRVFTRSLQCPKRRQRCSTLAPHYPSFSLPDFNGHIVSDAYFGGSKAVLVAFICKHCPFVRHIRQEFSRFAKEYQAKGLGIVAIASNDTTEFPEDGPAGMKEEAAEAGYTFPYLFDEKQTVAKAFRAACTPDLFLFDGRRSPCVPWSVRRKPTQERRARQRCRSACRSRGGARGQASTGGSNAEHRLQHQMEPGQRTGVLQDVIAVPNRLVRFRASHVSVRAVGGQPIRSGNALSLPERRSPRFESRCLMPAGGRVRQAARTAQPESGCSDSSCRRPDRTRSR